MTNKDDEEMARAVSEFLVPWDWNDVILHEYKDEHIDWCRSCGLVFGKDFYVHIEDGPEIKRINPRAKWPFPEYLKNHHYLFKDPAMATAFTLTFLT
jgi:hypothetical protein